MEWWQAVILGVVEGLTEYLPVSSTGHLILAQRALGIPVSEEANAYAICIQAGAIVAVLGLYWRRVARMARGTLGRVGIGPGDEPGLRLATNVIAAFIPAMVLGVLFDDLLERYLFNLPSIAAAWFVGGVAILAVAWWRPEREQGAGLGLDALTWRRAVIIGLMQCIAMWPGTSRSLVTIVGGVLVGLSLAAAVEFSFLLGVLTLLAATVYKAREAGPLMLENYGLATMLVGSIAAWVSAVVAVEWMLHYLKRHGMQAFGYYRIALAVVVVALMLAGVLPGDTAAEGEGTPVPHASPAPAAE